MSWGGAWLCQCLLVMLLASNLMFNAFFDDIVHLDDDVCSHTMSGVGCIMHSFKSCRGGYVSAHS